LDPAINEGLPQIPPRSSPPADEAVLVALRARLETLAHELEVLRHEHHQLHVYHHHLRFRLAERANLWLRELPLVHRLVRDSIVAAQAIRRCFSRSA
jgi:hypothetical protein